MRFCRDNITLNLITKYLQFSVSGVNQTRRRILLLFYVYTLFLYIDIYFTPKGRPYFWMKRRIGFNCSVSILVNYMNKNINNFLKILL